MKTSRVIAAAASALLLGTSSVSALGVKISGTPAAALPTDNDFTFPGFVDTFIEGTSGLGFVLSDPAKLIFTGVFAESGFVNTFTVGGDSITEDVGGGSGGVPSAPQQFDQLFAAGGIGGTGGSTPKFEFTTDAGGAPASPITYDIGDAAFGVYFNASANGTTDGVTEFFLALDDQDKTTKTADDNHDDYIVRVNVVPLPAAGWMLIAAAGGLFGAKRFRKTA